jgi:hypothetical protein
MVNRVMKVLICSAAIVQCYGKTEENIDVQWQSGGDTQGITTTKEDNRGNWYYKRRYLQDSKEVYEKIRGIASSIDGLKDSFIKIRAESDTAVIDCYQTLGYEEGELAALLQSVLTSLEKERKKDGQLNESERTLEREDLAKKKELEQMMTSAQRLRALDQTLDEGISTLLNQINKARSYEKEAWQLYDKIAELLSDTSAQQLYHEMMVILENIQAIESYITHDLRDYFSKVNQDIITTVESLHKHSADLKNQGILLEKKLGEEELERAKVLQEEELKKKQEEKLQQQHKEKSFVQQIKSWFYDLWQAIYVYVEGLLYRGHSSHQKISNETVTSAPEPDKKI